MFVKGQRVRVTKDYWHEDYETDDDDEFLAVPMGTEGVIVDVRGRGKCDVEFQPGSGAVGTEHGDAYNWYLMSDMLEAID